MSTDHRAHGQAAEDLALAHLEARGLRCVARNFRTRRGELDLVMRDGRELVFVEVRRRRGGTFGDGIDSITTSKRRRLAAAADAYLRRCRGAPPPCRFDIVSIDGSGTVDWLADAFTLDD